MYGTFHCKCVFGVSALNTLFTRLWTQLFIRHVYGLFKVPLSKSIIITIIIIIIIITKLVIYSK
jgi:hypothetical protein